MWNLTICWRNLLNQFPPHSELRRFFSQSKIEEGDVCRQRQTGTKMLSVFCVFSAKKSRGSNLPASWVLSGFNCDWVTIGYSDTLHTRILLSLVATCERPLYLLEFSIVVQILEEHSLSVVTISDRRFDIKVAQTNRYLSQHPQEMQSL